jgi:hypothetical protein
MVRDAMRYRRLQILGCAVVGTKELENGHVSRFTNLDAIIDADLKAHPHRGEAKPLRALEAALQAGVASGFALVPINPNAAIATAIGDVLDKQDADGGTVCWYTVGEEAWRAGVKAGSLAAAPAPGEVMDATTKEGE